MSDTSLFLGKFLRHGTAIASLAPSSPWLSRTTVRNVDWSRARVVVELGAGTGPITRVIAGRAHPDCKVVVLERDPDFARLLRERFQGLANFEIVEGDVRDLAGILSDRSIGRVDHVISGLPVPSFPKGLQKDLFRVVRGILAPEATYNQITELPLIYWPFYRRYFEEVRFAFQPLNFPPAGAYFCRGAKDVP
ncbi:MAG: methyltransferase domain-containing protein [Planctomycetia bacterium]|nr:methyltransferase domain-containing protein [Planctomycetia bacterium]